jgi:hypothetical protein
MTGLLSSASASRRLLTCQEPHGLDLKIVTVPYADADTLGRIEEQVLQEIDPPFNLKAVEATRVRARISELRRSHRRP